MKVSRFYSALLTLLLCAQLGNASNILGIFMYTFGTPYTVVTPFIKALVDNGHNVTIISSVNLLKDIEGVRHIRVPALDQLLYDLLHCEYDPDLVTNKWKEVSMVSKIYYNTSRLILSDFGVQSLLKDENEQFDMILMEPSHTDALLGIGEHFDAVQVGFSAFECSWMIDYMAGNSAPSVYVPVSPIGYSRGFSLFDMWNKWIYIAEEWLVDQLVYLPSQLKLFRRYFPYPAARLYHRRRNFSLILINHHFSLGRVRSSVPNVIEVAGIHLEQPSIPLGAELLRFVDEAEHGVIYFSMGLEITSKWLPKTMQEMLLETFSQLSQRVVWKTDMETLSNKSDNIYISSLVAQRELLAHPNLKLFITHGGLLSIMEAVNSAVPMLGLPLYYDQFDNMERMQREGVARSLDLNAFTVELLTENINQLLQDASYALNAKELSTRFRDQQISPLSNAVWWTEYVLRHKGAPHMRMPATDMSFVPYYCLNIISVLLGRIGLTTLFVIVFVYKLISCVLRTSRRGDNLSYCELSSSGLSSQD